MRFLTVNLLHGGFLPWLRENRARTFARLELLAAELARLEPEVVAVQEALVASQSGAVADWLAARLGYAVRFAAANPFIVPPRLSARVPPALRARVDRLIRAALDFEEGIAILSRLPMMASSAHELPHPRFPLENRIALRVRLAGPAGPFDVWNVHLTRAGGGHRRQAEALVRLVARESARVPLLVLGDFNADDTADGVRAFAAAGFRDAYRSANPCGPGLTAWQRVDSREPTVSRRVDYCWLAPEASPPVVRSEVVLDRPGRGPGGETLWPSDHYGLLTELAL
jgi:endonuclease/exonuclease/phosphatase family metal-dependent hydrolase